MLLLAISAISERIERLEFMVRVLGGLLLAVVAVLLVTTLRAFRRQVILRDRNGKTRLSIGMDDSGDPEIALWGRDAKSWSRIGIDSDGLPCLGLSDKLGQVRFLVNIGEGGPLLSLLNENGEQRMMAGFSQDQIPSITILDQSGRCRIDLTQNESGGPYLVLFDGETTRRLAVGMAPSGEPALVLFGKKGEERIGFGFGEDGDPFLRILDEEGQVVYQLHPARNVNPEA